MSFFFGGIFPVFWWKEGARKEGRKEGFLASVAFVAFVAFGGFLDLGLCGFLASVAFVAFVAFVGFLDLVACVPSVATWLLWLVWLMFFRGFLVFYGFRGFYGFEVVECFNMSLPFLPVKVVCNRKQRQNWRKRIE
jgi:hypothetical protein